MGAGALGTIKSTSQKVRPKAGRPGPFFGRPTETLTDPESLFEVMNDESKSHDDLSQSHLPYLQSFINAITFG